MNHRIRVWRQDGQYAEFDAPGGQTLLVSAERQCPRQSIDVGCRGGGCGLCRIRVLSGSYEAKVMSKAHIGDLERRSNIVLACRIFPTSDMEVQTDRPPERKHALTHFQAAQ